MANIRGSFSDATYIENMMYDQRDFDIRCEWGERGVSVLAPISDVVIIVDVLSFSTSVDIAVSRGALVYPYARNDEAAQAYAASLGAVLAESRRMQTGYSLSPASLLGIPAETRIVLPSPNGSALSLAARPTPAFTGCLRNARAVAAAASQVGRSIAVIPAGERWKGDGSLRPSFEDLVGAGAIISHLPGRPSPEARLALAAFHAAETSLASDLRRCGSGQELIEAGFERDVLLAAMLNVSDAAPSA